LIRVYPLGYINENFIKKIETIIEEFYVKTSWKPVLLEVYVYSTGERMRSTIFREAEELGVVVVGDFTVMHEAWRGWPRIHISYEDCRSLDDKIFKSILVHELAHSKLHGSPYYYVVNVDRRLMEDYGSEALTIAYLASIAIKDLEVLKLLKNISYGDEIISYTEFIKPQLLSVRCYDITGLLEFVKLIAPYVISGRRPENLDASCSSLEEKLVEILEKLIEASGDLEDKIKLLVSMLKNIR